MSQITVIVPVYKVEPYIDRCVESILSQSFSDFDLVLVDDGSPDSCPQICDRYAEKDSRITVIHKQNGGLSDARNAGIDWAMEHSDSRWLAFVDSDDYIHPDYLKTLYETAEKEEADLVICDFIRVNEQDEIIEKKHQFFELVTEDKSRLFQLLANTWRIDMAWNKLYTKSFFEQLRFIVGKVHEDEFAIHHVLWNCQRAAIINCGLYYYRKRENSIMASESIKSKLDNMEALIEQYEFCVRNGVTPRKLLVSHSYLAEVTDMKYSMKHEDLSRYKQLKKRLASIYFSIRANRRISGVLYFYFNRICRMITRKYKINNQEKRKKE